MSILLCADQDVGEYLEWIVIVLIAAEILVAGINIVSIFADVTTMSVC